MLFKSGHWALNEWVMLFVCMAEIFKYLLRGNLFGGDWVHVNKRSCCNVLPLTIPFK